MENRIKVLKDNLSNLAANSRGFRITAETKSDFEILEALENMIDSICDELYELTGDEKYNNDIEAVEAKLGMKYYEFREYGPVSISELNERKQAKIEIIKKKHKENGITNLRVTMENIHIYYVDKNELEEYFINNRAS